MIVLIFICISSAVSYENYVDNIILQYIAKIKNRHLCYSLLQGFCGKCIFFYFRGEKQLLWP